MSRVVRGWSETDGFHRRHTAPHRVMCTCTVIVLPNVRGNDRNIIKENKNRLPHGALNVSNRFSKRQETVNGVVFVIAKNPAQVSDFQRHNVTATHRNPSQKRNEISSTTSSLRKFTVRKNRTEVVCCLVKIKIYKVITSL